MPRFRVLLSICLLIIFLTSLASSQTSASPQRDPNAITIIATSLAAMGLPSSPNLRTLAQGTIIYANEPAEPIAIETVGTDRIRDDLGTDGFAFVSNAGAGFVIEDGSRHKLPSWVTEYRRPEHLPALSLMTDYLDPNLQVQYLGLSNLNGSPAHHLRLSMGSGNGIDGQAEGLISEFHVYIDQASLLVVKIRTFDFSPETPTNRSPVDTIFSDYRQEEGALIPFHSVRYVNGQKYSELDLTSISLNANLPDSDFQ